jgi:hypothetical protein
MFNPLDWYWLADDKRVYASARQLIVDDSDATYMAWTDAGNIPTLWPRDADGNQTTAELQSVLTPYNLWVDLIAYTAYARYNRATGGVIVTSITSVPFHTDPAARNSLANAYECVKATPGSTVNWKLSDASFVVMNEAQLQKATTSVATFVQNCFTCESNTQGSINGGTITTQAEIDAAFAAVSNTFP